MFMKEAALSAGVIGSPLSGALMQLDGLLGLRGWQWLFIAEAIPAVVLGWITFFVLPDHPEDAEWLMVDERQWLSRCNLREQAAIAERRSTGALRAMADWKVFLLVLSLAYFKTRRPGLYTVGFWAPLSREGIWIPAVQNKVCCSPFLISSPCLAWFSGRETPIVPENAIGMLPWHVSSVPWGWLITSSNRFLSCCRYRRSLPLCAGRQRPPSRRCVELTDRVFSLALERPRL